MPTSYRIDRERHFLFTRATGVLKDEDLRMLQHALMRDPEMRPGLNELHDRTGVTACELSTAFVWESCESFREFDSDERLRGMKVAIAATKDVMFGVSLMYETLRIESPIEFQVFRCMPEAREWLGLPVNSDDTNSDWKEVCL